MLCMIHDHNVAIFTLQVLSKRIHYGKFVAEAKFRASPDDYEAAIRAQVKIFLYLSIFLLQMLCISFLMVIIHSGQ